MPMAREEIGFADLPAVEAPAAAPEAPAPAFTIDEYEPEFEDEARALDTPDALAVLEMPPEPSAPELEVASTRSCRKSKPPRKTRRSSSSRLKPRIRRRGAKPSPRSNPTPCSRA